MEADTKSNINVAAIHRHEHTALISKQVHASTGCIKLEVEVELEVVFSKETNYPSMAKPILLLSGGHFPLRIKSLLFPVEVNYSLIESHFWIQWKPLSLCLEATCTLNGNHFHFGWKLGLLVEASFLFSGKHSAFDLKWLFLDEHHFLFESKPVFVSGGHFSFERKPPLPPVWVDFSLSLSQFGTHFLFTQFPFEQDQDSSETRMRPKFISSVIMLFCFTSNHSRVLSMRQGSTNHCARVRT